MSIQISSSNNANYKINCNNDNNNVTKQRFSDVIDTKLNDNKSLSEDDKSLTEELTKLGIDLDLYPLEYQKQHIKSLGFPPFTAPANVKKAWGEMLEKMPVGQRAQFQKNIIELMSAMKSNNKGLEEEMKNPNFSYSNFTQEMLNTASVFKGIAGFTSSSTNSFLTEFEANLNNEKNI